MSVTSGSVAANSGSSSGKDICSIALCVTYATSVITANSIGSVDISIANYLPYCATFNASSSRAINSSDAINANDAHA